MSTRFVSILAGIGVVAVILAAWMIVEISTLQVLENPGYAGFGYDSLPDDQKSRFPDRQGALIREIVPGSPAHRAGLRAGDLLIAIDGQPCPTVSNVNTIRSVWQTGRKVQLEFVRPPADPNQPASKSAGTKVNLELISEQDFAPLLEKSTPAK